MQPISGTTQLLGLIGDPVGHSLSPAMHNAALAALGEDYCYVPFPVAPDQLATAVAGLAALGVQGFNVTIPHKQAILPFLLQVDPRAAAVGAVNTVYRLPGGGWAGTNTDIDGFLQPLLGLNLQGIPALILGCGGAARAVIQGCVELGIQPLRVVGRSPDKLAALQHTWPQLQPVAWADLDPYLAQTQLVINTTPIGMKPGSTPQAREALSPLSWEQLRLLPAGAIVYDLIYVPNPTLLLRMAADLGHTPITGLEMLIQQGAKALSLWLGGKPVPVEVMRQAAQQQLAQLSQDSSPKPPHRE
ncbi:shikimate dehydrogenase [Thermostichus vulcanus]|uniref:Shikimate dehydrogenase (NADP(+)) n=1 Tax=Thermostichus vulcanus str. 'Rupite' TaxID=2813851 RepID=A0ABT0CEM6_THEVL|nr:shikimate dehydrogenase [Thermostichus vulcanus]MCJ2544236.1 shikimate dehydrogenase [Thermostichus vulcanus str. 'Rupite']